MPVPALPRRSRSSQPGAGDDASVHLFFQAPAEAPTTRGFAGILHEGLDGLTAAEVLAVPDDAPYRFGLVRGRLAAAAARHGGDAEPDQAPGPAQVRRGRGRRRLGQRHPRLAGDQAGAGDRAGAAAGRAGVPHLAHAAAQPELGPVVRVQRLLQLVRRRPPW